MGDKSIPVVVIDNGSSNSKAGFAGCETPFSVIPSIVGRPKHVDESKGLNLDSYYIGYEAQSKRKSLCLKYPIEHGIVTNWDDMEKLWSHIFSVELNAIPEDHRVFLTEGLPGPKANREKMTQIMFETFHVHSLYVSQQAFLSLAGSGRTTGAVLNSGASTSNSSPVYEGYLLPHAVQRFECGGRDLTDLLMKMHSERGNSFTNSEEREIVREMKEKHCYVSLDYEAEILAASKSNILNAEYQLPDGSMVMLGKERFMCPEGLFQPNLMSKNSPGHGIHQSLYQSIMKTDVDIRSELYSNILLSGGSTMFEGIEDRLSKELSWIAPESTRIRVIAPPERKYSVWIGGSIVASLPSFETSWISHEEYEESGPGIVHRKCY